MLRVIAAVVVLGCGYVPSAEAQALTSPPPFKLRVLVTLSDAEANVLRSSLTRELRKLDSVEIVDDENADNELSVVAVASGVGYAASVVLTAKADVTTLLYFTDDQKCFPTPKQEAEVEKAYGDVYVMVMDQWVFTGRDVQNLAARIAAAVDVNDVERHRQSYRKREALRRQRQTKKQSP